MGTCIGLCSASGTILQPLLAFSTLRYLLPFTFLWSTSVAVQAFAVFNCDAYEVDAITHEVVYYVALDPVRCRCEAMGLERSATAEQP